MRFNKHGFASNFSKMMHHWFDRELREEIDTKNCHCDLSRLCKVLDFNKPQTTER